MHKSSEWGVIFTKNKVKKKSETHSLIPSSNNSFLKKNKIKIFLNV